MADFFFNYYLMPFHLSVVALILLSVVETIGMYIGLRPSQLLKKIAPVWLSNSPLLNVKFSKALIFVFLLINFSFAGYFLQLSFFAIQHYFISPFYLIVPAIVIAIFFTVFMIHCLDQVIKPKLTHTNYNLLGRLATVSSGNARPGFSAQARVRDEFGQLHYVQVEPEYGELELYSQVILVRVHKSHYVAKKISISNDLFAPD
ncbi:OB-fold-containig protein [Acinetobacter pittii]|uniref:OB-fold-containig protein n=1 Tax=Acinetobacter pittii TaxID=48296 RepID=UPI003008C360